MADDLDEAACIAVGIEPKVEWWVSRAKHEFIASFDSEDAARRWVDAMPSGRYDVVQRHFYPPVSTDIAAAWRVVELLRQMGWIVRVQEMPDGLPFIAGAGWGPGEDTPIHRRAACLLHRTTSLRQDARRQIGRGPVGMAETAPEAICKAAVEMAKHLGPAAPAQQRPEVPALIDADGMQWVWE